MLFFHRTSPFDRSTLDFTPQALLALQGSYFVNEETGEATEETEGLEETEETEETEGAEETDTNQSVSYGHSASQTDNSETSGVSETMTMPKTRPINDDKSIGMDKYFIGGTYKMTNEEKAYNQMYFPSTKSEDLSD